jgi:DNA-binding CsgD family transcriptional regulator
VLVNGIGRSMKDAIDLIETVYSLDGNEQQWLQRLAEAFRPHLPRPPRGVGLVAYTYDVCRPDRVAVRATALVDYDLASLERDRSKVSLPDSEQAYVAAILRTGFVGTLRRSAAALRRAGLPAARLKEYQRRMDVAYRKRNVREQFWINAQDPTYFGCAFIATSSDRSRWPPAEVAAWRRLAAHVSAAFRIRRQFGPESTNDPNHSAAEAILNPNGSFAHATEPAQGETVRTALRRAVRAFDQARGPLRHRDAERAMDLWQALVAGRWSLLDHFDSDGRRFVVAHRNDAAVPDIRGLTVRERQVAAHVALGHSNKVIAYQLGLPVSTVGWHLTRARAKLRRIERILVRGPD